MAEETTKAWGSFADLALMWCQAFMDDNDYIILMIYLQKRKWILKEEEIQEVIQDFDKMILPEMRSAAMNLQSVGIVKLDETKTTPFSKDNNFKTMMINVEFVECLERQWRILDEKCKIDKLESEKQQKSQSNKYCNICNLSYTLMNIHLDNLKCCKKVGCGGQLMDSKIDETKQKHVLILERILEKIKAGIEICRKEAFPNKDEIEQSKKMEIEIAEKKFLDEKVENQWDSSKKEQVHKVFKQSVRKLIEKYVQRKSRILSNKMNIE